MAFRRDRRAARRRSERGLARQASTGRDPETDGRDAGEQLFSAQACAGCHTVRGTTADGTLGPDLTARRRAGRRSAPRRCRTRRDGMSALALRHAGRQARAPDASARPRHDDQITALVAYLEGLK